MDRLVAAMLYTDVATLAAIGVNTRLRGRMQFQLACYAGTAHSQVLERTTKAGLFVTFEVVHCDDDVSIRNGCSNFGCLAIFSVDFDLTAFGALQAIGNDYITLS